MTQKKKLKTDKDLKAEIDKSVRMFDVAKPGQTPASPTSRPIIVNHGAMVAKDPMVRGEKAEEEVKEEIQQRPQSHGEKVIKPLSEKAETKKDEESEDTEDVSTSDEVVEVKKAKTETKAEKRSAAKKILPKEEIEETEESEAPEPASKEQTDTTKDPESEPEQETGKSEESEPEPEKDDNPDQSITAQIAEKAAKNKENQKEDAAHDAKVKEVQASIESKEFFVPIGQVSRRRSKNIAILTLVLLLAGSLAFLNFAVDAEMIDVGVDSYTDLL